LAASLAHSELTGEVLLQCLAFTPTAKLIKERIEDLIEREYLARHEEDLNRYSYLA
jgi:hypothetical protein